MSNNLLEKYGLGFDSTLGCDSSNMVILAEENGLLIGYYKFKNGSVQPCSWKKDTGEVNNYYNRAEFNCVPKLIKVIPDFVIKFKEDKKPMIIIGLDKKIFIVDDFDYLSRKFWCEYLQVWIPLDTVDGYYYIDEAFIDSATKV